MPLPARPLAERFWEKVERRGDDECWLWKGTMALDGYGKIKVAGREMRATHAALLIDARPVTPGTYALHTCHVPACVNPRHLYPGTPMQNMIDREQAGHTRRGESGASKLRAVDVRNIRVLWAATKGLGHRGFTQSRLARMYGVRQTTIWNVVRGQTWRAV